MSSLIPLRGPDGPIFAKADEVVLVQTPPAGGAVVTLKNGQAVEVEDSAVAIAGRIKSALDGEPPVKSVGTPTASEAKRTTSSYLR